MPLWLRPLCLAALGAASAWLLWLNLSVVAPFALSVAMAYVLRPAVSALQQRHVPHALASALAVLLAMLMLVLLAMLLVPIVVELVPRAREQLPDLAERVWHVLVPHLQRAGVKLPSALADLKPLVAKQLAVHGDAWAQAAINSLRVGGSWLFTFLGLALLVPMLAFYWLLDWDQIAPRAVALVPPRWRLPVSDLLAECDTVMGRYLPGQLLVMLALAAFYSVGLALFGFDLALPIGVFTGLAVFIPYLGFGLGLVLAVLSGVLQAAGEGGALWWPLLGVGVVYGLGQLIESMVLTPRLVGEQIGLHPGAVILMLMLFGQWLGFVGVLMALPVSALLMVLMRRGLRAYQGSAWYRRGVGPAQGAEAGDE